MRAVHVIGIVGEGAESLVRSLVQLMIGVPITNGRPLEAVREFLEMSSDLKEQGMSDLADIMDDLPIVFYVPHITDADVYDLEDVADDVTVHVVATTSGYESAVNYVGVAAKALDVLRLLA